MMSSTRRIARWGALAMLVALMSGCCILPYGPRGGYYGGGYYGGGHHEGGGYGGGGHYQGGYGGGPGGGDGYRH